MADRSSADRACKDPNPIIDGRKANVNLAYLGAKPRVMQQGEASMCCYEEQRLKENIHEKKPLVTNCIAPLLIQLLPINPTRKSRYICSNKSIGIFQLCNF